MLYDSFIFYFDVQERSGAGSFNHGQLAMKYKLDNEFELVFVVSSEI